MVKSMKLRNKKTGLTGKLTNIDLDIYEDGSEIYISILLDNSGGECIDKQFYSIDELKKFLKDWEDVKEPLIKDEKVRKAVRAWAEANSITYVEYRSEDLGDRFNGYDFEYICFNPWKADNLKDCREYTITELCGEEK